PNQTFPSSAVTHGKASPQFGYIYDPDIGEWRPITPGDFVGLGGNSFNLNTPTVSGYRNLNLSGEAVTVSDTATKLAGFFIDNDMNDEPLFIHFYSNPYTEYSVPILTYPLYAQSTVDQNFPYSIEGFQGIIVKISEDREGIYPWPGNGGTGAIANIYYRS
ncbi:MAG: hypothetical protein EBS55_15175, partial [Flavobacteriaceae bacterium]|nr:hypothetical protein [Flavobacteriaceae bacterium]